MDSTTEAKTAPSLKSNVEEALDLLHESVGRLDHQIAMLTSSIGPVLREPYPVPSRDQDMEKKNQSVISESIWRAILNVQDMSFAVGQMIDRVDC